jgi:hypothetical protein
MGVHYIVSKIAGQAQGPDGRKQTEGYSVHSEVTWIFYTSSHSPYAYAKRLRAKALFNIVASAGGAAFLECKILLVTLALRDHSTRRYLRLARFRKWASEFRPR